VVGQKKRKKHEREFEESSGPIRSTLERNLTATRMERGQRAFSSLPAGGRTYAGKNKGNKPAGPMEHIEDVAGASVLLSLWKE